MSDRASATLTIPLPRSDRGIAILLGAGMVVLHLLLIVGHPTPFNYFGLTANAIWNGHLWIDGAPLSEIERGLDGHFYNVQPPLPALLALPFVPFGRADQIEVFASALFGALSIIPIYLALRAFAAPQRVAVACALLSSLGTTLFYTSIDGRSWFAAHAGAVFFASVAVAVAARRGPPVLIGAALGAAALGRTPLALAIPGLVLLATPEWRPVPLLRNTLLLCLGGLPFAMTQGFYDLIRWGNPLDVYGPQLHQADDPVLARGFMSLSYVPRKIYAMFFQAPVFVDGEPLFFLRPRGYGLALVFTTPALAWLVPAVRRIAADRRWIALAAAAVPVALPGLVFATVGYEQYGYRYSLDVQPFLIPLVAVGAAWTPEGWRRPSRIFYGAIALSILLTIYFFATIRRFGFAP